MLRKVANITLAFMMVFLTTGFTISKHFCHDRLRSAEVFALPDDCHDMGVKGCCEAMNVPHCQSGSITGDNCCRNENTFVKFVPQFTVTKAENVVEFVPFTFAAGWAAHMVQLFGVFRPAVFNHPPPPLLDITVFIRSLLL